MAKNKNIITILFVLMGILIIGLILFNNNRKKGGEDALTVFSVGSSELTISDDVASITLTDKERDSVIGIVENIVNKMSDSTGSKDECDITIDFKNGYKAYISSQKSFLYFENEIKEISEEDLETILSYLKDR